MEWTGSSVSVVAGLLLLCFYLWKLGWLQQSPAAGNGKLKPLPPGPTWSWPVVGVIPSLGRLVHKDFTRMANKYGPIVYFKIGKHPTVVVSSADIARELLGKKDREFVDRVEVSAMQEIYVNFKGLAFGKYTEQAPILRKIFATELMTRARIKSYENIRREDGKVLIKSIYDAAVDGGQGGVELRNRLAAFAANVTTQMLCRRRFHGPVARQTRLTEYDLRPDSPVDMQQLVPLVGAVMEVLGTINIVDYLPALKSLDPQGLIKKGKAVSIQYDKMLAQIVREHREFHKRNPELMRSSEHVRDFVDVLLLAQEDEKITDVSIKGAISDVLLGFVDSQLVLLEWGMTLLIRHPQYLEKAQEEMDRVVGRHRLVEDADLANLPFLRASMKEAMRCIPPFPLSAPRTNHQEAELGGYRIPRNTHVFLHIENIGHDPAVWKDPLQFNPDRFMETGNLDFNNNDQFDMLPFGSGRRGCPGKLLGTVTSSFALALMVQAFQWGPPPGLKPEEIDMDEMPGISRFKLVPLAPTVAPRLPASIYTS